MTKVITFGDKASLWPQHLAEYLEKSYKCFSHESNTNEDILKSFFENADQIKQGDIVSVNFTYSDKNTDKDSNTHIIESLKAINLVLGHLERRRINYIATCIDKDIYKARSYYIKVLQNSYKSKITWFGKKGIDEWAQENNYTEVNNEAFKYIKKAIGL